MDPISVTIALGIAANALYFVIDKVGKDITDKKRLEKDLNQAFISTAAELEQEFPSIIHYLELFFSNTEPGQTRRSKLLKALFSEDKSLEEVFLTSFQHDFAYRLLAYGRLEALPIENSQIDFVAIRSKFEQNPKEDLIARSIAIRFLTLLREKIGKAELPLAVLARKIVESQKEIRRNLGEIKGYLEPFDYLTVESFVNRTIVEGDDFYFGVEPRWSDILSNKDFRREELQKEIMVSLLQEPRDTYFLPILGNPKSGKTTFIRRLAYDLVWDYGKDVLWLKRDHFELIAGDQIREIYRLVKKPLYIFYDNIINNHPKWRDFISDLIDSVTPCYLIGTMYIGEWDISKAPPKRNVIYKRKIEQEPYRIINTRPEIDNYIHLIRKRGIRGEISIEEALSKAENVSRSEGEQFLGFIYFYTEDKSFRDSILDRVATLRKDQYDIYNGLVWLATFYQFGIYIPKSLIRMITNPAIESGLVDQPWAQKYVYESEDLKYLHIFNHIVAQWIFIDFIKHSGNGGLLEDRLGLLFRHGRKYKDFETEAIFFLFMALSSNKDYQHVAKDVLIGYEIEIKRLFNGLSPEFLALLVGLIYIELKMFEKSFDVFSIATTRDTELSEAYNNWGGALFKYWTIMKDEKLIFESFDKFKTAIEKNTIKNKNSPEVFYNWGTALFEFGKTKSDVIHLLESLDRFSTATDQRVFYPEAYFNWGNALAAIAEINKKNGINDQIMPFLEEACIKYEKATDQQPVKPEAYINWGKAKIMLATQKKDEVLFTEAIEICTTATVQNPASSIAYYNLADASALFAGLKIEKGLFEESIILYMDAIVNYEKASTIEAPTPHYDFNWGTTLYVLATLKENKDFLRRSIERFKNAVTQQPIYPEAYCNWGNSLRKLGALENDEHLLKEASEKYLTSGFQFIINGTLNDKPFLNSYNLTINNAPHVPTASLFLTAISFLSGVEMTTETIDRLEESRKRLRKTNILSILIDTLVGVNGQEQTLGIENNYMIGATKILINSIIEMKKRKQ